MNLALGPGRPREARAADTSLDSVLACIRVPKSGSESLRELLSVAFDDHRQFYLPNIVDADGKISTLQRMRFRRAQARNLLQRYGTFNLQRAFDVINAEAETGDLIEGGHFDFATVKARVHHPVKMIAIFRDPVQRSISEYNYSRGAYFARSPLRRGTAAMMSKIAGKHDFDGFLDFLLEHRAAYGDVASRYAGWNGTEGLDGFFARNVFHAGILEQRDRFAEALSEKLGKKLAFPHENQTAGKSATTATAAQRAKIEKIYARDCTLYDWLRGNL
jgi:hypothetical protein